MDIVEDVKPVVEEVKSVALQLPGIVDLGDLKVLLDLQKDLELVKSKAEAVELRIVIVQMRIQAKYQMNDADHIDPKTGEIIRS